ncbi:MAG: molybdenum transporter, periplasmic molybdate-binding protein [Frankiales bacterium]|nr:molybdenum transporter, periplasmic molybdate-binding protein [Frankiales bacterium]
MKAGILAALSCAVVVSACGSDGPPARASVASRTITVFAASSLTKAFTAEAKPFEAAHPGLHVRFSFAGSQSLVVQIKQGAPADVLATADTASMAAAGLSGSRVFARNRLSIITAPANPKHIATLRDLARPGVRVVLAGPTVPVGKAAGKALAAAGVTVKPVSLEQDVKGVVTKVRLGEADAGIAYVTDVKAATDIAGTPLPAVSNSYPVAVVTPGADATAFAEFLLSPAAQSVLASLGFLPPA